VRSERSSALAAFVQRCGRLTSEEAHRLAGAQAMVEDDPAAMAAIKEGVARVTAASPDAMAAADAADWAFRCTLPIPGDGILYAAHDPIWGRAISAISAHAMAVVAQEQIPADVAGAMSRAWNQAVDPAGGIG
jgi:hypothetical protein